MQATINTPGTVAATVREDAIATAIGLCAIASGSALGARITANGRVVPAMFDPVHANRVYRRIMAG